ncbi:hypothetical protein TIFTF001_034069 [Ficus carica]|uniref:Uncharacterized protein n=1 Tax=Ficus carica TaxID=3494 RepID=A0AA88E338_FICCA|nr:hypothetical protein TIFTF001_034069 [Ficus carica]
MNSCGRGSCAPPNPRCLRSLPTIISLPKSRSALRSPVSQAPVVAPDHRSLCNDSCPPWYDSVRFGLLLSSSQKASYY